MEKTQQDSALERVYKLKELPQFVGLRATAIHRMIRDGEFPKPIRITKDRRAIGWLESDLRQWQQARAAAR